MTDRRRAQGDEGDRLLAEHVVRAADHGGLQHGGVAVEDVLDLLRIDVLAAPDDHVLDPVDQDQVAVVVEVSDVAGVQPSALAGPVRSSSGWLR